VRIISGSHDRASKACQQLVKHASSETGGLRALFPVATLGISRFMSAASKACQQLVKHASSETRGLRASFPVVMKSILNILPPPHVFCFHFSTFWGLHWRLAMNLFVQNFRFPKP
jgi:hypothetical protein